MGWKWVTLHWISIGEFDAIYLISFQIDSVELNTNVTKSYFLFELVDLMSTDWHWFKSVQVKKMFWFESVQFDENRLRWKLNWNSESITGATWKGIFNIKFDNWMSSAVTLYWCEFHVKVNQKQFNQSKGRSIQLLLFANRWDEMRSKSGATNWTVIWYAVTKLLMERLEN